MSRKTEEEKKAAEEKKAEEAKAAEDAKKKAAEGPTPDQLVAAVRYLKGQNETLAARVEELSKSPKTVVVKGGSEEDLDLETLSREEFMKHIFAQAEKSIVKPIREQLAGKDEADTRAAVRDQIRVATESYGDFWEFEAEIKGALETHPNLSIDEAYHLARGKNSDKASAIDAKAAEVKAAAAKKEAETKAAEKGKQFGGLLPTSGQSTKSEHMEAGDAAEAAWEETGAGEHLAAISN